MNRHLVRYAPFLALVTAVISGASNFLAKIAVTAVKDPVVYTTLKNTLVAVFLFGLLIIFKKRREILSLTAKQWVKLVAIAVVGGSVPFVLFFIGLSQTTALNAALIHETLFLWVALLAIPILKERVSFPQAIGIVMLFGANLLVGGFTGFKLNTGELLILAATVLWAVENIIAKNALREISSLTVVAARMVLGSFILLIICAGQGSLNSFGQLNSVQWGWTLLMSALLLGYVVTWYVALKHAPATLVAALLVPATLVTNVLSVIFIGGQVSLSQTASSLLFIAGTVLMIAFAKKSVEQAPVSPKAMLKAE